MSKIEKRFLKKRRLLVLLLILLTVLLSLFLSTGGVSNSQILRAMRGEHYTLRWEIISLGDDMARKFNALDKRLDAADRKLDRIDEKLDRLLQLANPPLPDGLQRVD